MKKLKDLKTFEDACQIEGLDASKVIPEFEFFPEKDREAMKSISKLVIITKAANRLANDGKEWIPDWDNMDEWKYENWFSLSGGSSGFRSYGCDVWLTLSHVGSRLCFISSEVGEYVAKQFLDLYKEFYT